MRKTVSGKIQDARYETLDTRHETRDMRFKTKHGNLISSLKSQVLSLMSHVLYLASYTLWFIICIQPSITYAQSNHIDMSSALQKLQRAKAHSGYSFQQMEKCLLPYITTVCDNWKTIPLAQRRGLSAMFQRPDNPESWWYKAGLPLTIKTTHFKLHYTTTGADAVPLADVSPFNGVPDFVDVCAEGFEKSYRVEIAQLGYKTPYDDFWVDDNGGDERYDIYLFSGPWGGFTMPEFRVAVQSTSTVTSLYFGVNSKLYTLMGASRGKEFLDTTCAHEFHHAIQFSYNYYMYRWFMEGSSTWMERMVYDGSEQGETDGNNYYNNLLVYWFRYPDWSLTRFDGWHEYGDVIWIIFLTERYDLDIIKEFYESLSEGSYRELANFNDAFASRGTTLGVAFKEFTLWNYFTGTRRLDAAWSEIKGSTARDYSTDYLYDDRFYSRGFEYPSVSIHLDNIHREYPVKVDLDSEQAPENLGARYIRFLPAPGQDAISIKVDGSDVTNPDDLQILDAWGTRGWGAKLVIYRKGESPKTDEILLFHISQEGQRDFKGFGTDIEEIVLIISNLHPELETDPELGVGGISYSAGPQPAGRLSVPRLSHGDMGEIVVSWDLLDISDIAEVAIVRKRFALFEGDQDDSAILPAEVYSAPDADNNGLPDGNVNIVGKVGATDTVFVDNTVFSDVNVNAPGFDPSFIHYYYAVVPLSEYGIMGKPAIASEGITPSALPPTVNAGTLITQGREFTLTEEKRVICYPNPFKPGIHQNVKFNPAGFKIRIFTMAGQLVKELSESEWDGTDENQQPVSSGIYIYYAEGIEKSGRIAVIR